MSLGTALATPTVSGSGRPADGPALQGLEQLAADAEDLVGIAVHQAPHIGEDQPAALPFEQLVADHVLEQLDLRADGGLREPQLVGGARHAAFPHDGPEVEQVVVVQPVHMPIIDIT